MFDPKLWEDISNPNRLQLYIYLINTTDSEGQKIRETIVNCTDIHGTLIANMFSKKKIDHIIKQQKKATPPKDNETIGYFNAPGIGIIQIVN